jgi:hypothetical protein
VGYERPEKLIQLQWAEGEELHGLEVTLAELSVDRYLSMQRLSGEIARLESGQGTPDELEKLAARAGDFFGEFAAGLRSWNLTAGGQPVPADRAGAGSQGLAFILGLAMQWMGAMGSVDTPLPNGSNGSPPAEASIPMTPMPNLSS